MNKDLFKYYSLNTLLTLALAATFCNVQGILGLAIELLLISLLAVVFYHCHYGLGCANVIMVAVVFVLFQDVLPAIVTLVPIALLAVALALGLRLKLPFYKLLFLCTFLFAAELLANLQVLDHLTGGEVTISSMMLDMGRQLREVFLTQYADPAMEVMVEQAISMTVDLTIMLAPAMFLIVSIVLSYALLYIFKKMQQRRGVDMSGFIPFSKMQGDKLMAFVFLVLLLIVTAAPSGLFFDACVNVLLILGFIFVVLGLSAFDWKMKQKGTAKPLRRLLIISLFFLSTMMLLVPVLALLIYGATDCLFDYRHLRSENSEK
ncbi:MAG: DUF2232 domain-containing protein [Clostridia bacterium]|nr:DUF2232 domain-containing protein [Clostridia bacterium]